MGSVVKNQYAVNDVDEINTIVSSNTTQQQQQQPEQQQQQQLNNRPIIAVLAQRYPDTSNQSYIAASYVKYLESGGARVVPVPHHFNSSQIQQLFNHINGVLLPGGSAHIMRSDFYDHAKQLWDLSIAANDRGDYFPMWGTCLGFQVSILLFLIVEGGLSFFQIES